MFKILWNFIKLLFLVTLLGLVFQQFTARFILTLLLRTELGVPIEVEHAQVDFLKAQVRFQNVEIWNPKGFAPGVMVYIRELVVDSELSHVVSQGRLNLDRLELTIDNVRLLQNSDGQLNFFYTKPYQNAGSGFVKNLQIENFVLSVDRAGIANAGSREGLAQEIGLNRMGYRKVKSLRDVFDIVGWETLSAMKLQNLGRGYLSRIGQDLDGEKIRNFSKPSAPSWH